MTQERAWEHLRGLEPLSLCDWPGHPCCVLFFGGCNLHCPTCHNAELAFNMQALPLFTAAKLKTFLSDRRRWLSGVAVTGGEPTAVPGIGAVLHEVAKFGLPVKLDTNGMLPEVVEALLDEGLVQTFAVDVKGPFDRYPELTGGAATEEAARRNLGRIFTLADERRRENPEAFLFRTTQVPALSLDDIESVRGLLPAGFTLTVQEFQTPRRFHALADHETRRPAGDVVH